MPKQLKYPNFCILDNDPFVIVVSISEIDFKNCVFEIAIFFLNRKGVGKLKHVTKIHFYQIFVI